MILKRFTWALFALTLITAATASDLRIAGVTAAQPGKVGSLGAGSENDDMANFKAALSDALLGQSKTPDPGNSDSRYQSHVGLGFALGTRMGDPNAGDCAGDGHENQGEGHRDCGEPSPSD